MYIAKSVFYQASANKGNWIQIKEDDLDQLPVITTLMQYSKVYVYTENTILQSFQTIALEEIVSKLIDTNVTIQEALTLIDDTKLTHIEGKPEVNNKQVIYADAVSIGFNLELVNKLSGYKEPDEKENTWLGLTREKTNYERLFKHTLVSINGFLHPTDYDTSKLYVQEVLPTINKSEKLFVGMYSFENIGEIVQKQITDEMIVKNTEVGLYERTIIDTGVALKDYSVAISIGGYLHIADGNTVATVGDSIIAIDWFKIPLINRLFESKQFLDLSSLPLSTSDNNSEILHLDDLKTNEFISKYLTLNQSFLILIKNTNINVQLEELENGPGMDRFYCYNNNRSPLINTNGKLLEYWKILEYGVYSYYTPRSIKFNYIYKTVNIGQLTNIDDALVGAFPQEPEQVGKAVLKHIGTSQLNFVV